MGLKKAYVSSWPLGGVWGSNYLAEGAHNRGGTPWTRDSPGKQRSNVVAGQDDGRGAVHDEMDRCIEGAGGRRQRGHCLGHCG